MAEQYVPEKTVLKDGTEHVKMVPAKEAKKKPSSPEVKDKDDK